MALFDRPRLRPLSVSRRDHQGQAFALIEDPSGVMFDPILLPIDLFIQVIRFFDGQTTLAEVQSRVLSETSQVVSEEFLDGLVKQLDQALILDGPAYARFVRDFRESTLRAPALAGRSYPADGLSLGLQLDQCFAGPTGAGPPALPPPGRGDRSSQSKIRAIISPHIDFQRGGPVYTWSYKELVERSDADLYVILGVAHQYCRSRFVLTYKDFETPLGIARTDRDYVNQIAELADGDFFSDELVHRSEHSIEFQVVFLQHVLGEQRRDVSIVPILVGSFHDLMDQGIDPMEDSGVRRFVEALQAVEAASGKRVVYIGGIDLCHVGPQFGDPAPVDDSLLRQVRQFDEAMLRHAADGNARQWFQTAAREGNRLRVCGLAANYTMLRAIGPSKGRLLKYDQALDESRTCCVSFASMVFHSLEHSEPGSLHGDSNSPS
jgi:MEMO1 family protein